LQKSSKPTQTTSSKPNRRAPSFNPGDDEKVVIIGEDEPKKTTTSKPKETPKTTKPSQETSVTQIPPTKQAEPSAAPPTTSAPKTTPKSGTVTHVVEAGQTYFSISKMYEVTVNDILAWNNLTLDSKLSVGQKLNIRPVGQTLAQQPQEQEFVTHTVAQGETMFSISQKYGVKIDQIKEWNSLTDNGVKIGQQLKIKKP
ncbi:MAG: LysM peptidoglycan-binding domain-containing protein, partial [Spirosomaceae bacterium]|nr:LysM peptidoglycan-binding domain-containing protein [Spirosomataceae bacterium]